MTDDRKIGKIRELAVGYSGSKTGRFSLSAQHSLEAMSRIYRQDPPKYSGEPWLCTRCKQPMVKASMGVKRCECRHDVRQRETKQAAMERRAHWLLKREFDEPDPVLIRDWKTSYERIAMLPPSPATPYKVDYVELEKRWMELNEKMTNELIYGGVVTNNKDQT